MIFPFPKELASKITSVSRPQVRYDLVLINSLDVLQRAMPQSILMLHCPTGHTKYITSLAWEPAHIALPSQRFCSGSKDATIRVSRLPHSLLYIVYTKHYMTNICDRELSLVLSGMKTAMFWVLSILSSSRYW